MAGRVEETISVLIPVYNEEGNLSLLYERLELALKKTARAYEIIFVDDGSSDGSPEILLHLREKNPNVKIIVFQGISDRLPR